MANIKQITNPSVTEEHRTWRATIETPRDGNYSISVHRETIPRDEDGRAGKVVPGIRIERRAAAIAGEKVTLANGTVVPAALILAALPLFFDRWAQEDGE